MNRIEVDDEYLVQRIIDGSSIRDLAKEYNCSPACVFKRVRKNYQGALIEELDEALKKNRLNSNVKRWSKKDDTGAKY